jgi:ABC-2 type transport system permease protein
MTTIRMEWMKLRSAPGTAWSVLAMVGAMLLLTVLITAGSTTSGCVPGMVGDNDVVMDSLFGVYGAQIAVVTLAVMAAEYGTGTIGATFLTEPRRRRVLAAKALVVGAVVLGIGLAVVPATYAIGRELLAGGGFDDSCGYTRAGLGELVRPLAGSALYLAALALLCLGVAAILRHSAAAVTAILALLFMPLIVAPVLPETASDWVLRIAPMSAGLAVQRTVDRADSVPIGEWVGLGVIGLWAAAALVVASWLVARRDV